MKTRNLSILIALSCIGASAAANYDLLGRKGSQMNSPMVYKNVDYAKKAAPTNGILAKQGVDEAVYAVEGVYEAGFYGNKDKYTFFVYKPKKVVIYTSNTETYKYFTPVYTKPNSETFQEAIQHGYGNVFASKWEKPTSYNKKTKTYTEYTPYLKLDSSHPAISDYYIEYSPSSKLRAPEFFNGYISKHLIPQDSIGIYYTAVRPAGNDDALYTKLYESAKNPNANQQYEATILAYSLASFSPNNISYIIDRLNSKRETNPSNPELYYPQILVGLHTEGDAYNDRYSAAKAPDYSTVARDLDEYIYNNHVVEIVGAGNFGLKPDNAKNDAGYLTNEAYAANAITVGSVDVNNKFENTCSWKNAPKGGQKPEIYNYTNYYPENLGRIVYSDNSGLNPSASGTRGAATNTAAAVADLLRAYPFLKWHPEVVKARLLTSSDIEAQNVSRDSDRETKNLHQILDYAKLFDSEKYTPYLSRYNNYSRFWNGNKAKLTQAVENDKNGRREIRFTTRVYKDFKYRAAIAWLSSGKDIYTLKGKIPQDIDLAAYWHNNITTKQTKTSNSKLYNDYSYYEGNDKSLLITSSTSPNNPYEVMEFTAQKNGYVTFVITVYTDESIVGKDKLQLGFNLLEIVK